MAQQKIAFIGTKNVYLVMGVDVVDGKVHLVTELAVYLSLINKHMRYGTPYGDKTFQSDDIEEMVGMAAEGAADMQHHAEPILRDMIGDLDNALDRDDFAAAVERHLNREFGITPEAQVLAPVAAE